MAVAAEPGAAPYEPGLPPMKQEASEFATLLATVEQNLGRHPRSVLEIGCYKGGTVARFLRRWPLAVVIGLDVAEVPPVGGVQFVLGDSTTAEARARVRELWPGQFDLVHVDGDHRLPAVTADYEWARDELRARMIALHDVAPWSPDLGEGNAMEVWKLWHEIKVSGIAAVEIRHNVDGLFGIGLVMAHG